MPTSPLIAILYLVESDTIHRVTALSNSMDLFPCVVSPSLSGLISSLDGAFKGSFVKHPLTHALYVNTLVWVTAADHTNNWNFSCGSDVISLVWALSCTSWHLQLRACPLGCLLILRFTPIQENCNDAQIKGLQFHDSHIDSQILVYCIQKQELSLIL